MADNQKALKCPKGMKLHKQYKGQAALMFNKSNAEKNFFMRTMGIAVHEAATRMKKVHLPKDSE